MKNLYHIDYVFSPAKEFGDFSLHQIGRLFCSEGAVIKKHLHLNWFELTIVTDGKGVLYTNDVDIPIKSGDIYLSFPADRHEIISDDVSPLKYDFCSFFSTSEELSARLETILQTFRDEKSRLFSDDLIKSLVQSAIAEFQKGEDALSKDLLFHLFHLLVMYLLRAFPEAENANSLKNISQADILCYQLMTYIDTHIFTLKNLSSLSELTNYNYSYLSKLFSKTTGRTLVDYYQSSKLKKARILLKEDKLKVGEIAELLNYSSVFVFSKAYKRKYGYAPTETKRQ